MCKADSASTPYVTSVNEFVTGQFPAGATSGLFQVKPSYEFDDTDHRVEFSISRCPEVAPDGCGNSRRVDGEKCSYSTTAKWLSTTVTTAGSKPSLSASKLATSTTLDAEACKNSYAATVMAELYKKAGSILLGRITCVVNIIVGNINEPPRVVLSSLVDRSVSETELPGFLIGTPLEAEDVEVAVGLQQLTWSITSCQAFTFKRDGTGSWQSMDNDCHIKISACDGQLLVSSGTRLDYEMYTKYKLIVQVMDDGSPVLNANQEIGGSTGGQADSQRVVNINVIPLNDPPTMPNLQTFYIKENVVSGTFVTSAGTCSQTTSSGSPKPCVSKADCPISGESCTNTLSTCSGSCLIKASDPDTKAGSGFTFVQSVSQAPFVITPSATKTTSDSDSYYHWTTVKYSSTTAVLDYESGDTQFDITVFAKDGPGSAPPAGRSADSLVTIIVVDDNDKPYLVTPQRCDDKLCVSIEENNNEGDEGWRGVDLEAYTRDDDMKSDWQCCRTSSPYELSVAGIADNLKCDLTKFEKTANGFRGKPNVIDFESGDTCDLFVKIWDKDNLVSDDQLLHIKVTDINDPPTNVALASACSVDENAGMDIELSGAGCQITATDEDDTVFTFLKSSPPGTDGTEGFFFSSSGTSWNNDVDYFRVSASGKLLVQQIPDYEIAKDVKFNVYARDGKGRSSSLKKITITINDVNEAPIIDQTTMIPDSINLNMDPGGSGGGTAQIAATNLVCTASFAVYEFKKNGANVIANQPLVAALDGSLLPTEDGKTPVQLPFQAADPDQGSSNAEWRTVKYSLTPDWHDSNHFEIDENTGVIKPKSNNPINNIYPSQTYIDFELLVDRPLITDHNMRINVVAKDLGGAQTDCDVYITVIDVNEPPYIEHMKRGNDNVGESELHPLLMSSTSVKIGTTVGSSLPAKDPDVKRGDFANCRLKPGVTIDDRLLFDITKGCQIYVKALTSSGKDLTNAEAKYTLTIEAYDQGVLQNDGSFLVEKSDSRTYYILSKPDITRPEFTLESSAGAGSEVMFSSNENVGGTIVSQKASGTQRDYSFWGISSGDATALFAACTDENVFQRGTTPGTDGKNVKDCSGNNNNKVACIGTVASSPLTKCVYNDDTSQCEPRQQSLRYEIVQESTYPEAPAANSVIVGVDKVSGEISFTAESTKPNYEDLIYPDEQIHCDLGAPVRSGKGDVDSIFGKYRWIGRFPNGVKGICRMFDNDLKKTTGKKEKLSYLDAASLCAKGGGRLPLFSELVEAAAQEDSVTREGGGSGGDGTGVQGEPANPIKGGTQGIGKYGLRPMNILDTWNWQTHDSYAGKDVSNCRGHTKGASIPNCQDKAGIDSPVKVWTYNGDQAVFSAGGTISTSDLWTNSASASTVTKITRASTVPQEQLPVLCYRGTNYVNPKWYGNSNTPDAYSQKASKPVSGYSALIRCSDTADFTIDESRMEYYQQAQNDDKYVFIEIVDEPESPYFQDEIREYSILESQAIGSFVLDVQGLDQDSGEGQSLVFELTGVDPVVQRFELGSPKVILPSIIERSIPLNIKSGLDYELQSIHTMTVRVTDVTDRTSTQTLKIRLTDVNEPPVLRLSSAPSDEAGSDTALIATFTMKEDAPSMYKVGKMFAWDPDGSTTLLFTVSGADNQHDGNDIFETEDLPSDDPTIEGAGPTGKIFASWIVLREDSAIDYETQQTYTLDVSVSDGSLSDTAKVRIDIENVNDVTVDSVRLKSNNSTEIQTEGNQYILITGTNFGIKSTVSTKVPTLKVTYGRLDMDVSRTFPTTSPIPAEWFEATDCSVNGLGDFNTEITCKTTPGHGAVHAWRVEVATNGVNEGDGTSNKAVTTSYITPVITGISVVGPLTTSTLGTRGGQTVILTGTNFGAKVGLNLQGYYGKGGKNNWYCASNCKVTVANTEATCDTVAGIGKNHVWRLEIKNHQWFGAKSANSPATSTSYMVPSITDVANCPSCTNPERKEFTTYGNQDVYINGDNFGPMADSSDNCRPSDMGAITIKYDNLWKNNDLQVHSYHQKLNCVVTIPHVQIKCKTMAGVSKDFIWTVTVSEQTSAPSSEAAGQTTFYSIPIIQELRGSGAYAANTEGGQKFYLEGDYFGPATSCAGSNKPGDYNCINYIHFETMDAVVSPSIRKIFEGVKCFVKNAQTLVECETPVGVGKNFKYEIMVGNQPSLYNTGLTNQASVDKEKPSYARPVVSVLSRSQRASTTPGSPMDDVDTRGFVIDQTQTPQYANGVIPETILISGLNFGPLNSGTCSQTGRPCASNAVCLGTGETCTNINSMVAWNPTTAVYVAKKPDPGSSTVDSYVATNCIVVVAHTQMKCDVATGAGRSHEWTVTVGQQDSLTPTSSYHQPILNTITGPGAVGGKTNGAQFVQLNGLNFGPYADGASVTYGVTGIEYTPTNCEVESHSLITCNTVPGIGPNLFWQVTVRQQANELMATTSYAAPYIHSITPAIASADGSDKRIFLAYLNVSNSGLADPLTRRKIQFDIECCQTTELCQMNANLCGSYEIEEKALGPELTRQEGQFDIIAFDIPMLMNQKDAVDIPVSLIVYPFNRDTGTANRGATVRSSNVVLFSYDSPVIDQVVVLEHPTNPDQLLIYIIGQNFGSINIGEFPVPGDEMKVLSIPYDDDGGAQVAPTEIPMQLGEPIKNGAVIRFVQKWDRGAENERYDKITLVWAGPKEGKLQITRGGESSNIKEFKKITPQIRDLKFWELEPVRKEIFDLPTLGSKTNGEGGDKTIQIDLVCGHCGTENMVCTPGAGTCPDPSALKCPCKDVPVHGVPADVEIWLGSTKLSDRQLQQCPIVPGAYTYTSSSSQWKFTCNVPAYQGYQVDTRIKVSGLWSEPSISKYRPPVIDFLSRSVGGTKGASNFNKENYVTSATQKYLEIPTNGDKIKITGHDFGKPHHGQETNVNTKYVSFDGVGFMPTPMAPAHGGLSIDVPPGTGSRMRQVNVTTGQFANDIQVSNAIEVKYRAPTLVAHLVPLWRFDDDGNAGGYEVTLLGYDFSTSTTENLNKTIVFFKGTPCEVTFTSYKMIKCTLGFITSTTGNIITSIAVADQTTSVYVSDERKTLAKNAMSAGEYTQDDLLIDDRVTYRDTTFKAQVDKCVGDTYGSDGLSAALDASRDKSIDTPLAERTPQQQVVAIVNASTLSQSQKERAQCVALVQQAFDKKCSGRETGESRQILDTAYTWDDKPGKRESRTIKCWWDVGPGAISGGYGPTPTGPDGQGSGVDGFKSDDYVGRPIITRIYPTTETSVNIMKLNTQGGVQLTVEAFNMDQQSTRAVLVDDNNVWPDIWVNNGKTLPPSSFYFDGLRWNLQLMVPPGQGLTMRLKLISTRLGLESVHSGFDIMGFAAPKFNETYITNILNSPTDSCQENQFESELSWAARIDNVGKKKREENPGKYRRKCQKHFEIKIRGINFGKNTTTLKVWIKGTNMLSMKDDEANVNDIIFPVFDGSKYQTSDVSERGFAGCVSSFCFQHKHNELTLMGPEGYGADCTLYVSVAGQQINIPFSFQAPEADYSEPNPYSANGDSITIHGQNFGGVASNALVIIDGEPCKSEGKDYATWFPEHPVKGLPYISCKALQTMAGIANISVFVAGQQSRIVPIKSVSRAGVRSVCKDSELEEDIDLKTGQSKAYWGRIDPARELCTACREGSGCMSDTYAPPFSTAEFYIQKLDISGGRNALYSTKNDLISVRERRDYSRAVEQQSVSLRVCPPERLLDPVLDAKMYKRFEQAVMNKRDFCLTVLPCKPAEACMGKNVCAEKYEANLLRCKLQRSTNPGATEDNPLPTPVVQYCNHTLQCRIKSMGRDQFKGNGETCALALVDVCRCPTDWELSATYNRKTGSPVNANLPSATSSWSVGGASETWTEYENDRMGGHECMKQCIRDAGKLASLVENGCLEEQLQKRLGGGYPDYFHEEDSATCVPRGYCVNSTGFKGATCLADKDCDEGSCQVFGECECEASPRCIECTAGTHYRRDGKCEECPKNMILVFVGFFVGIVVLLAGMYYLDQQDFNLAFVSIPVDYFQVLALFSRADIRWPPALLEILYALRFFNFNIDVATPECLLVGLFTYEHKFYATLLLLPCAGVGLLLIWGWHCIFNKYVLHRSIDKLYSSKLVGTFLLSVYFMFLSVTTRALEVFNCSPTDPDDGWTYTDFTDRACDGGGLCRCGDPEHLPWKLAPFAITSLLLYTLGFPVLLFWILRCGGRKNLIKEDQILRAAGVGDTLSTNNRAFFIRVKYHKMYCTFALCFTDYVRTSFHLFHFVLLLLFLFYFWKISSSLLSLFSLSFH